MATYLLTWNSSRWEWKNFARDHENVQRGTAGQQRWSCGNSRSIEPGGRFFLIRLGNQPKGIIATGKIVSPPYEDIHWDRERQKRGESCWFIRIEFQLLSHYPLLGWEDLQQPGLKGFPWGSRSSGIQIRSPYLEQLQKVWDQVSEQVKVGSEFMNKYRGTFRELSNRSSTN